MSAVPASGPGRAGAVPPAEGVEAVYTDVDGTILRGTSIFDFLLFDAARHGRAPEASRFLGGLRAAAASGTPRAETNRRYFTWWRGRAVGDVDAVSRAWLDAHDADGADVLRAPVARALDAHAGHGARLVAVTASFPPALAVVRRRWPAMAFLTTHPHVRDGRYTGSITTPLVGEAKAAAVAAHARVHAIDLTRCAGYGDHDSDLPFLRLTGSPTLLDQPRCAP